MIYFYNLKCTGEVLVTSDSVVVVIEFTRISRRKKKNCYSQILAVFLVTYNTRRTNRLKFRANCHLATSLSYMYSYTAEMRLELTLF